MRISPLRQRMIGDMTARHFSEKAQKDYIRCVKNLAAFIGRPPETATAEDLRLYRLHLVQSPLGASSVNSYMTALRFFFSITLDRYDLLKPLFRVEQTRKLPTVLTQEEVARLLDAAPGAKYRAALSVAYGAGLRASEVLALKVSDIDSAGCCCASSARIASPCSPRCCSIFCESGTASADPAPGCFRARTRSTL